MQFSGIRNFNLKNYEKYFRKTFYFQEYTEEQKCLVAAERIRIASEYGNDFETIQKYCLEKWLTRQNSKRDSIIDEEILIQIAISLCSIDSTFLTDRERLQNSAVYIRSQVNYFKI